MPTCETKITFYCVHCELPTESCTCQPPKKEPGKPFFEVIGTGWGGEWKAGPQYVFPGPAAAAAGKPSCMVLGSEDDPHLVTLEPGEIRTTQETLDKYGADLLRRLAGPGMQDARIVVKSNLP